MKRILGLWPIGLAVVVLATVAALERWKYRECRSVGHSRTYCVLQVVDSR